MNYNHCPTCKGDLALGSEGYIACQNESCTFVLYENPTPVVAAVIEYGEGNILLAHNVKWPPKWYALVTGFLEKHEHPDEAVVREVKEEVGLDCEIREFLGHYSFKRMNQLIIAYHVYAEGEIVLQDDEIDDVRILPFEKVKTWNAGTGKALKKFLESRGHTPEEIQF